jgi:hypothetical protein
MSYKLVDLCMDIPSLTSAEWSVLVALCRYASNDDHTCFPSLEVVATVAHLTLRTVQRTIPSLVERKLVTIFEKANGRGNRNKFRINATLLRELKSKDDTTTSFIEGEEEESTQIKGDTVTPIVEQERVTLTPSKGDIVTPQRVTPCRIKGDIDASYIGRICQESVSSEAVSESVNLALTSDEVPAGSVPKSSKSKKKKPTQPEFQLPSWIEPDVWAAFEEMRDGKKKPMTDYSRRLIVKDLEKLEAKGFHSTDVLNQSIVNSYQGVFELKQSGGSNGNGKRGRTDGNREALQRALGTLAEMKRDGIISSRSSEAIQAAGPEPGSVGSGIQPGAAKAAQWPS